MSRRVPARSVLRSEWTKLRTLRAAGLCLLLYAVAVGVGAWTSLSGTTAPDEPAPAVARALVGFAPAQLVLLALGALVVTSEYRSGTVLVSLTAVPGRTRWLAAKTVVVSVLAATLTTVLAVGCVVAVPLLTSSQADLPLTERAVLGSIGLQVAGAVLVTVLAVGLGALLRRTWAVLVAGVLLVAVLPLATAAAGQPRVAATSWVWPTLRVGAGDLTTMRTQSFFGVPTGGDLLPAGAATPWTTGLLVAGCWAMILWLLGAVLLERRDA